jgi:hypothetical protein
LVVDTEPQEESVRRRWAAFAAAAGLTVGILNLPSALAGTHKTVVWVASRVGSGPTNLVVEMSVGYDNTRAILAASFARTTASGVRALPDAAVYSDEGHDGAYIYAPGQPSHCVGVLTKCSITRARGYLVMAVYYGDDGLSGDSNAADRIYMVTTGTRPVVHVHGTGNVSWRVRATTMTAKALWADTADNGATGAWTTKGGAEVFTTAELRGGPNGSLAMAVPPCSGTVNVGAGVGSATLSGGRTKQVVECPRDVSALSDTAPRKTTWRFDGLVAGLNAKLVSDPGPVRLLVIDFA